MDFLASLTLSLRSLRSLDSLRSLARSVRSVSSFAPLGSTIVELRLARPNFGPKGPKIVASYGPEPCRSFVFGSRL